jgi:hypothetical protein
VAKNRTKKLRGSQPATQPASTTVSSGFRPVATIVGFAVALQAFVWAILFGVFGIMRAGYWFFELSDIAYYYQGYIVRMAEGLRPFRDFFIEYPPLFLPLLAAPGTHLDQQTYMIRFAALMMLFMAAACAVTALTVFDGSSIRRPVAVVAVFSGLTLLLGPIAANRYDPAVALVLALALLLMARDRWVAVAVVIGIGFALKVTPAILLPLTLIIAPPKRAIRMVVGFAVAAAVPFAWVLLTGGNSLANLSQMFAYHLDRPLEIESLLATVFWLGKLMGVTTVNVGLAAGSQVIVSRAADLVASLSSGVLLLALGSVFVMVWRRRQVIASSVSLTSLAVLAALLASLVGSKVLSPQYFVWIVPAVALVAIDRRVLGALMATVLLLTHVLFPANYWQFADVQASGAIWIVVLRNLILLTAFALSLWYLWTIPEQSQRSSGASR